MIFINIEKCIKCGNKFPFTNEFFTQDKNKKYGLRYVCKNCSNKQRNIDKYKTKYGLILDFDKYFDTYTIYEWWHFLYDNNTPNGKQLIMLPLEIINENNLLNLLKYIYQNILNINEIDKFNYEIINKYKICFIIKFFKLKLKDFVKYVNESLNIKLKCNNKDNKINKINNEDNLNITKNIKKSNKSRWTKEEIYILKNNEGKSIESLLLLLPNKNYTNIYSKAKKLNIKLISKENYWKDEEILILKQFEYSNKTINDILLLLPNRSKHAIEKELSKLKITLKDPDTIPYSSTNEWMRKDSRRRFYKKYGIEIDNKISVIKYDIFQWWKWVYYGTPNGEYLNMIPYEFKTEENIKKLCRFIIENIIGLNNKISLVNNSYFKMFLEYKMFFEIFAGMTLYDILNFIYPEYNIKPYDLKNVSLKYWQSKQNFDEYINYVLNEVIKINELTNIKKELPIFFKYNRLDSRIENVLIYIRKYHHYKNILECLNILHPEYNLEPKDFSIYTGIDGKSTFYSFEEKIVFDFIYTNLNLKTIKAIGSGKKSKYRFYPNNGQDEYYCPDFYLDVINSIKLDKPLIIEYYGLFDEKSNYKLLVYYREKTIRKEIYYSNNKNIYYVGLYPKDLKNNCQGIRNKINNFINQINEMHSYYNYNSVNNIAL